VLELSLRITAKGYRFWRDKWCIFDFVVSAVVKYLMFDQWSNIRSMVKARAAASGGAGGASATGW
jgi:hypothetical protein